LADQTYADLIVGDLGSHALNIGPAERPGEFIGLSVRRLHGIGCHHGSVVGHAGSGHRDTVTRLSRSNISKLTTAPTAIGEWNGAPGPSRKRP
jgi:hypothetical protein